jgi:hypothetical protein
LIKQDFFDQQYQNYLRVLFCTRIYFYAEYLKGRDNHYKDVNVTNVELQGIIEMKSINRINKMLPFYPFMFNDNVIKEHIEIYNKILRKYDQDLENDCIEFIKGYNSKKMLSSVSGLRSKNMRIYHSQKYYTLSIIFILCFADKIAENEYRYLLTPVLNMDMKLLTGVNRIKTLGSKCKYDNSTIPNEQMVLVKYIKKPKINYQRILDCINAEKLLYLAYLGADETNEVSKTKMTKEIFYNFIPTDDIPRIKANIHEYIDNKLKSIENMPFIMETYLDMAQNSML